MTGNSMYIENRRLIFDFDFLMWQNDISQKLRRIDNATKIIDKRWGKISKLELK